MTLSFMTELRLGSHNKVKVARGKRTFPSHLKLGQFKHKKTDFRQLHTKFRILPKLGKYPEK